MVSSLEVANRFHRISLETIMNARILRPSRSAAVLAVTLAATLAAAPDAAAARESAALSLARQLNQAFVEVADTISPSVVVISVTPKPEAEGGSMFRRKAWLEQMIPEEFRKFLDPQPEGQPDAPPQPRKGPPKGDEDQRPTMQGSGVVMRDDGYVLTNNHVVENAAKIRVRLKDGREFDAELRGTDPKSDLAVIKMKGDLKNLTAVRFADSDKVKVGEFAIAIGAPFELDYSVTYGHVSAKGRGNIIPAFSTETRGLDQDFIQTDASINPGNSGGPLVNIDGEVIGINSMIRGMNSGIGFAIPSNLAQQVGNSIIENGKFARSWLGISIHPLKSDADLKDMLKGVEDGVVVNGFVENSPAEKGGVKRGDVIMAVDGHKVSTPQQLKNEIRNKALGTSVSLDVHRLGKNMTLKVKTEEWPESGNIPVVSRKRANSATETESVDLGLKVKTISRELAAEKGVKEGKGVLVIDVTEGSLAARKGIRVGDVITEVHGTEINSTTEFSDALKEARLKEGVMLSVIESRTGEERLFVIRERSAE